MHHGAASTETTQKRFDSMRRASAGVGLPVLLLTALTPNARAAVGASTARAADPPHSTAPPALRSARPHAPLLPPAAPLPVKPLSPPSASKALSDTPGNLLARGEAYARLGDYARALSAYTIALKSQPKDGGLLLARAEAVLNRDKAVAQLKTTSAALQADPNDTKAILHHAFAQYNVGEYRKAISEYDALINDNSDYVAAYLGRALAHVADESWDEAAADYRRAFLMRPDLMPVREQPSDFRLLVEQE